MKQPVCRLKCFGSDAQLASAMLVLIELGYAFEYSGRLHRIIVRTRRNCICRKIEKEFDALGVKTERHYDR